MDAMKQKTVHGSKQVKFELYPSKRKYFRILLN